MKGQRWGSNKSPAGTCCWGGGGRALGPGARPPARAAPPPPPVLQIVLAFALHERNLLLELLSPLLLISYHLAHLGLHGDTLALALEDFFLLLEVAVLDAQGP
jgi:hypothetical protein